MFARIKFLVFLSLLIVVFVGGVYVGHSFSNVGDLLLEKAAEVNAAAGKALNGTGAVHILGEGEYEDASYLYFVLNAPQVSPSAITLEYVPRVQVQSDVGQEVVGGILKAIFKGGENLLVVKVPKRK